MSHLRLGGNSLGDGGVAGLAMGLSANTTLSTLELDNNDITDTGLETLGNALDWKHTKCQLKGKCVVNLFCRFCYRFVTRPYQGICVDVIIVVY